MPLNTKGILRAVSRMWNLFPATAPQVRGMNPQEVKEAAHLWGGSVHSIDTRAHWEIIVLLRILNYYLYTIILLK